MINKRITQLFIYEGFVITHLILVALGALALQGQGATVNAQPMQEFSERGGSGGESSESLPLLQGWDALRESLPLSMQDKIAKVERTRQRKDELEQKRRERAEAKRRQLRLDLEARPRSPEDLVEVERKVSQIFERRRQVEGVDLSVLERQAETRPAPVQDFLAELPLFKVAKGCQVWEVRDDFSQSDLFQGDGEWTDSIGQCRAGSDLASCDGELIAGLSSDIDESGTEPLPIVGDLLEERLPTAWERDDFNDWYALAVQFKLVTNYQWCRSEYWVLVNGMWKGFCEMLQVFSDAWLRRRLVDSV